MPTREIIDQEATRGVEHAEVALGLVLEIDSLVETYERLTPRLNFSKTKLEDFKSKFHV